jgi:hypothetical protein
MKPHIHSINSAKKFGGSPEDYLSIHNFLDISKMAHADLRHRAILHNSLGPFIAEKIFGVDEEKLKSLSEKFDWTEEEISAIKDLIRSSHSDNQTSFRNSDGDRVYVRDVAEHHIIEDMGKIPSVTDYLSGMPFYEWIGHKKAAVKRVVGKMSDYITEQE